MWPHIIFTLSKNDVFICGCIFFTVTTLGGWIELLPVRGFLPKEPETGIRAPRTPIESKKNILYAVEADSMGVRGFGFTGGKSIQPPDPSNSKKNTIPYKKGIFGHILKTIFKFLDFEIRQIREIREIREIRYQILIKSWSDHDQSMTQIKTLSNHDQTMTHS